MNLITVTLCSNWQVLPRKDIIEEDYLGGFQEMPYITESVEAEENICSTEH